MENHNVTSDASLVNAIKHFYPDSSKRTIEIWIKSGRVFLNEKRVTKKELLVTQGTKLSLSAKTRPSFRGIRYIYQDRWIIVIEKPPFLLSVASENPLEENALAYLREDFQTDAIYPVHRLDRECSGVLMFARGKESQERFDALFEAHDLTREYVAIVEGRLQQKTGTWQSYLMEKENFDVVTTTQDKGKLAITHYKVVRYSAKFTYLRLILETGRKHQIRVHCEQSGHPILGDLRYSSHCNPAKRLCLHALKLGFTHPFTHHKHTFFAPLPKAFINLGFEL